MPLLPPSPPSPPPRVLHRSTFSFNRSKSTISPSPQFFSSFFFSSSRITLHTVLFLSSFPPPLLPISSADWPSKNILTDRFSNPSDNSAFQRDDQRIESRGRGEEGFSKIKSACLSLVLSRSSFSLRRWKIRWRKFIHAPPPPLRSLFVSRRRRHRFSSSVRETKINFLSFPSEGNYQGSDTFFVRDSRADERRKERRVKWDAKLCWMRRFIRRMVHAILRQAKTWYVYQGYGWPMSTLTQWHL